MSHSIDLAIANFLLRFGLAKTINTLLRLTTRFVGGRIFLNNKCVLIEFVIPNLSQI